MVSRGALTASLFLIFGVFLSTTEAQTEVKVQITQPQVEYFPKLNFYMDVTRENNIFVHGIQISEITLFEDSQSVPVDFFEELRTGVQLVVVFNPGSSFLVRDSQGYSRYDSLIESLVSWARQRLGSTIDDLSILVTDGPEQTHITNPLELFYTLADFEINEATAIPTIDTLLRAVEIASDPVPRPAMKRLVLFITSPIEGDITFGLENVLSQATQKNVRIYTWLVSFPAESNSQATLKFTELANQTGGGYFIFSGVEKIPNLESYLEPLRSIYFLGCESTVKMGGVHQLNVEINHDNQIIRSGIVEFKIDLQPPNPMFISPVLKITRTPQEIQGNKLFKSTGKLFPDIQDYKILVDFPDKRSRAIVSSQLFVDGIVVDQNNNAPFDQLSWDLSSYTENGQHILQGEVVDEFGLSGKTIETPVRVEINMPKKSPLLFFSQNLPLIAGFVVVLSGAFLLLTLIIGGKIHPGPVIPGLSRRRRKKTVAADSIITPVDLVKSSNDRRHPVNLGRHPNGLHEAESVPCAFLARIPDGVKSGDEKPYQIFSAELTIGRNPSVATFVVDHPSVDGLHARLVRTQAGMFRIMDMGSISGTWINYAPVSKEGAFVRDGDLIHIGRVGFRFTQSN